MAEELQDAAYRLPRVMLWATIINGGMMFVVAVTLTYCIGDLESGKCKAFMLLGNNYRRTLADGSAISTINTNRLPIHPDFLQRHRVSRRDQHYDCSHSDLRVLWQRHCDGRLLSTALRFCS